VGERTRVLAAFGPLGDEGAVAGRGLDESFGLQCVQGFAYGHCRDSVFLAERQDRRQPGTGRSLAGLDLVAQ
jgi:hypothetical protein